MEIKNNSNKKGFLIGLVAIIAVGVISIFVGKKEVVAPVAENTPVVTPVGTTPVDIKKQTTVYKDGSYSVTSSYMSPGGLDKLGVVITLKNDIVTEVSVTPLAGDEVSAKYQGAFLSGYRPLVIGKNIADLKLTKVSGSSLTPIGFNDAVEQIKVQAKA